MKSRPFRVKDLAKVEIADMDEKRAREAIRQMKLFIERFDSHPGEFDAAFQKAVARNLSEAEARLRRLVAN